MKGEQIGIYFLNQMVSFERNLIESAFLSEKAIHQLRVGIKKLRTLMNLLNKHAPYPVEYQYQFKQVTSIFKPLGRIRDNRNKVKLLDFYLSKEVDLKDRLKDELDGSLKLATDIYREKFMVYSFESFFQFKNEFSRYVKKNVRSIESKEAIRDKIIPISELVCHDDLKKNLHKIRSFVKKLLFTLQILKLKQMEFNGTTYVTGDLATLGEFIGQWHDYELLINLYDKISDQLHEPTTKEFEIIKCKAHELFEYVSKRLYLQFRLI